MTTARRLLPDGHAGIVETLAALTALKEFYGAQVSMRSAALDIAGSLADDDQTAQADRLAQFVRRSLVYVADPINLELIHTPEVLLAAINDTGFASGDCDDHVLLFSALCEALGIACDVAGVEAPGTAGAINHVIAIAHLPAGPVQFDLCAKGNFRPRYLSTLVVPSP